MALDLVIGENKITPIDVYGPNTDTPSFYSEFDNDYFVFCGELNIALKATSDTCNILHFNNPKAMDKVLEIMDELNN